MTLNCMRQLKMHDIKFNTKNCRGLKMEDWEMKHRNAGRKNAGLEIWHKKCRPGKCETVWKANIWHTSNHYLLKNNWVVILLPIDNSKFVHCNSAV